MRIVELKVYRYDLKLAKPITVKNKILSSREGLILKLADEQDNVAYGEIAPLYGFSKETLDEAINQTANLKERLLNQNIPADITEITSSLYPSVAFGFETSLLNIMAKSKGLALSSMINTKSSKHVTVNALLVGSKDDIIDCCQKKLREGFVSFKIKIKNKEDIETVLEVSRIIGDDKKVRVDANRLFNYEDAVFVIGKLKCANIEYIEEPFSKIKDLNNYLNSHKDPIVAIDETLRELSLSELDKYRSVRAFIIKPTMTGFMKTMEQARFCFQNNITPVISSSFESAFGIKILSSIASLINSDKYDIPAGLDTIDWFEKKLLKTSSIIENGRIDISKHAFSIDGFDHNLLEEIDLG